MSGSGETDTRDKRESKSNHTNFTIFRYTQENENSHDTLHDFLA